MAKVHQHQKLKGDIYFNPFIFWFIRAKVQVEKMGDKPAVAWK